MRLVAFLFVLLLATSRLAQATTWDEPWHEAVVKKADCFVLARITAVDAQKRITIDVLNSLAGEPITGIIQITSFYSLDLCSRSAGEDPEFRMKGTDSCYFFLQKRPTGTYALATPTTGFAVVQQGQVAATYRHSYHQALVPRAIYEPTMTAVFQHYHGQSYNKEYINLFVAKQLAQPPARIDKAGMPTFFAQHVALETTYHLGLATQYEAVLPFLHDTTNFHAQLSAVRVLTATPTPEAKQQLLKLLADKHTRDFVKVIAVQTLAVYQPKELKTQLMQLAQTASDKKNSFGGNMMDPRVCTRLPSVKKSLIDLIAQL
jgi:hypothetical protein